MNRSRQGQTTIMAVLILFALLAIVWWAYKTLYKHEIDTDPSKVAGHVFKMAKGVMFETASADSLDLRNYLMLESSRKGHSSDSEWYRIGTEMDNRYRNTGRVFLLHEKAPGEARGRFFQPTIFEVVSGTADSTDKYPMAKVKVLNHKHAGETVYIPTRFIVLSRDCTQTRDQELAKTYDFPQ
jgi:hypothetical protein